MRVTVHSESTRCYIADERACWTPVSYMFRSVERVPWSQWYWTANGDGTHNSFDSRDTTSDREIKLLNR